MPAGDHHPQELLQIRNGSNWQQITNAKWIVSLKLDYSPSNELYGPGTLGVFRDSVIDLSLYLGLLGL